ncbi:MAG: M23 family metallopeptidase [Mycoplasmatota bacterium]|nr:M23 family metallopeptidase [Mycoplasmatota bacterium]
MPNKVLKKKLTLKKKIRTALTRVLLTILIFLIGMILIKQNPKNKVFIEKNIYENSLKFTQAKELYKKYFGDIISLDKLLYDDVPVFNEKIEYKEKHAYKDGVALTVADKYMVPALESGIVIFIGEKEDYGQTIILEQTNGVDVFYSNIETSNIKLYDYIEKGDYLGEAKSKKLYLVFQKDGQALNYKDYI